jgi:plasmid maintenance system antidote protein VapI
MKKKTRSQKIAAGRARHLTRSRKACIRAGRSDREIAKLVGSARSTVQAWHTGARAIPVRSARRLERLGIAKSVWLRLQ